MDHVQTYLCALLILDAVFYVGQIGFMLGDSFGEHMDTVKFAIIFPAVQLLLLPFVGRIFGWF